MWIWIMGMAKPGKTLEEIQAKRREWVEQGKEEMLTQRCRSAQRYGVLGTSPKQAFWLIEADDGGAVDLIADHFGDVWDLKTRLVVPQTVKEALGGKG